MVSLRYFRSELEALATSALLTPFGRFLCSDTLRADPRGGVPVVFVHGLLGNRVHFRALRAALEARGFQRFATFCYRPRFDYQRLAVELGEFIERACERAADARVDIVGHSLGGLVARYLVEMGKGGRIHRMVTVGSPYYGHRFPSRELSIFAAQDLLVTPPSAGRLSQRVVIPDCGHLGLLHCPAVHDHIATYLKDGRVRAAMVRAPARRNAPVRALGDPSSLRIAACVRSSASSR